MEKSTSSSVLNIATDTSPYEIFEYLRDMPDLNFIHYDLGKEAAAAQRNIIAEARKNTRVRCSLVAMANAGFHLYVQREGVSSLVRHRRIPTLWNNVVNGEFRADENGTVHSLQTATGVGEPRLLVVFSSIASKMYSSSLMRHFEQNFSSIGKYLPTNTHILRIADLGSVVGSFYLNSHALPKNEANIHALITKTAKSLGVSEDAIVLYGGSKGGTAATYYGVKHGWRAVAVDPIVSDEHYVRVHDDSHFTVGTFPQTKQEKFAELLAAPHAETKLSVIYSSRSAQYPYIYGTLVERFEDRFCFLNSENAEIKEHPDVGGKTIPHALAQINLHLAGLAPIVGNHKVW